MRNKFKRILDLKEPIKKKSHFLFGPRQTGKSWLLESQFPKAPTYNLLLSDVFLRLSARPYLLREEIFAGIDTGSIDKSKPVIIDEIQKLPILLDEVHYLIEKTGLHFILTGSSARKLKRTGVNLLGGRAWTRHLCPLVSAEVPDYDLNRILNYGGLPSIYLSEFPEEDLRAYVGTYLKDEIVAEGIARNIPGFHSFLETAASSNGELLNFAAIASDSGVPARTVIEYYRVLEETLIGSVLEPFDGTKKRKAISTSKFYFFDIGVCNFLANSWPVKPRTPFYGKALEHFIFLELLAYLEYKNDHRKLSFWRSTSNFEVDFVLGGDTAIEVKSSDRISPRHLKGLHALAEDIHLRKSIIVCTERTPRKIGAVLALPVRQFLKMLWDGGV
ncbi:MAG: AAA family ATPase [Bdellovibrionota bacterium]